MRVSNPGLVGRQREQAYLGRVLAATREGRGGGILLVAGEAGVGKTSLVTHCLAQSGLLVLRHAASRGAPAVYGPIIAVLRACLRQGVARISDSTPLDRHLSLLLPELGPAPTSTEPGLLFEAVCRLLLQVARSQATVIFLDDLHGADNATLELLTDLVDSLNGEKLLVIAAYRSEEVTPDHPLRRFRDELRRLGQWRQIELACFDMAETAELASQLLGQAPDPSLVSTLQQKTGGLPLFVKELTQALKDSDLLQCGSNGVELAGGERIPIPETLRDAVLIQMDGLSQQARRILEVAAVLGPHFELSLLVNLSGCEEAVAELLEQGLIDENEPGQGTFRHALIRDVVYDGISWARRRALHRQVAQMLESHTAGEEVVAKHWLSGGNSEQARQILMSALENSCRVYAYRDAVRAAHGVLQLWPNGDDEAGRIAILERLAWAAQRAGLLSTAIDSLQEIAESYHRQEQWSEVADTQRQLATVHELQGNHAEAQAARRLAADAFAAAGLPGEAAIERLAMASALENAGHLQAAMEQVDLATQESEQAQRQDLQARILGLKGALLARTGDIQTACQMAQAGLTLALTKDFTGVVAYVYGHLGTVLEQTANFVPAQDAYLTAVNCCEINGNSRQPPVCLAHLAVALKQRGEWQQASAICREMTRTSTTPPWARNVASAILGLIHAHKGNSIKARELLQAATEEAERSRVAALQVTCAWGLAMVDVLEGELASAQQHGQFVLKRWAQTEDYFYAIPALHWAATFFATHQVEAQLDASVEALTAVAAAGSTAFALGTLAHALGEASLLQGDAEKAVEQFEQALALLEEEVAPLERIRTRLRTAVVLLRTGERQVAIEHLIQVYQKARRLEAQPVALQAIKLLDEMGESVRDRLGRDAIRQLQRAGLTRRQLEVLRLVADGHTNSEIALRLVVSRRTVDMHVRNIFSKLNCRSRSHAVHRAHDLGLL